MERSIWVYGNPDKSALGFPMPGDLAKYITNDVYEKENSRYRYTQGKNADVIVLSRDGLLYGHFEVEAKVKPNDSDRKAYPRVKFVYLVRKSSLYNTPVPMSRLSITGLRFGHKLSEDEFQTLQQLAGGVKESQSAPALPQSTVELERVLREVRQRLGQSDFRKALVSAYKGQCAVSGCDAEDALEAAHIDPYSGIESNDVSNGLLLRADIHTLFDRNLIGIEPNSRRLTLAEQLRGTSYKEYEGATLSVPANSDAHPALASLQKRWKAFQQRV